MTRTFLSRMLLVAGTVALVACGPRLKPIEYEEPKGSGTGAPDEEESTGGHKKKSTSGDSESSGSGSSKGSGSSSSGKSGPFKSCDDKANACGSACTECAPGDQDCMEVLVMKQCNLEHKCVAAPVDCSAPEKSGKDKKKAAKE